MKIFVLIVGLLLQIAGLTLAIAVSYGLYNKIGVYADLPIVLYVVSGLYFVLSALFFWMGGVFKTAM